MRWGIGEAAFGSGEPNAAPPPYTETSVSVSPTASTFMYASTRSRVR